MKERKKKTTKFRITDFSLLFFSCEEKISARLIAWSPRVRLSHECSKHEKKITTYKSEELINSHITAQLSHSVNRYQKFPRTLIAIELIRRIKTLVGIVVLLRRQRYLRPRSSSERDKIKKKKLRTRRVPVKSIPQHREI